MQGTLNEIDMRSILQLIELGQRSGELLVESYYPSYNRYFQTQKNQNLKTANYGREMSNQNYPRQLAWIVFFVNGKIAYATEINHHNLSKLKDYLYRYQNKIDIHNLPPQGEISDDHAPEYGYLWLLLEKKLLTASQGRSILQNMIQEITFDLFSLHQGSFIFHQGPPLAPQLISLEIAPLVSMIMKQLQEWKQLRPEIEHPSQCPMINNPEKLKQALPANTYQGLERFCDGATSLRQLSRYLNRDVLTITKAIYPYIQKGWVQLMTTTPMGGLRGESDSSGKTTSFKGHILCLDDDLTIVKTVEHILDEEGYNITVMTEPSLAIGEIFKLKPELILCDLAMPNLDGYEICGMLRGSSLFREIPIIILTGKNSYMDRVQANLLGATDYLTKPFGKYELLTLVEKYLNIRVSQDLRTNNQ
jgi:twitching motility two-component system response regulator PilG